MQDEVTLAIDFDFDFVDTLKAQRDGVGVGLGSDDEIIRVRLFCDSRLLMIR